MIMCLRALVGPVGPRKPARPSSGSGAALSFLAVMLFPDDLTLARRLVARLIHHRGRVQDAVAEGVRIDPQYMSAFIDDLGRGQPDDKLIQRRLRWSSSVGQIVKALLALVDDADPRVSRRASWKEVVLQAELLVERPRRSRRSARSGFHRPLSHLRHSLHMCCAFELARARAAGRRALPTG
jgi:hypothetical protein